VLVPIDTRIVYIVEYSVSFILRGSSPSCGLCSAGVKFVGESHVGSVNKSIQNRTV